MEAELVVTGRKGGVAAGHPAVARAGLDVLDAGGNAVDAAVAAMFTAFHAEPLLTSACGAGFAVGMMDGEPFATDFFASAPGTGLGLADPWTPDDGAFFGVEVDFGAAKQVFHIGAGATAVPGAVPGLLSLQSHAGRLPLGRVLAPAHVACSVGTVVTQMGAFASELLWPIVSSSPELCATFLDGDGQRLAPGATYRNPDMARFIEEVARRGSIVLSYGPVADLLVDTVQRAGGGLTRGDLADYRVHRVEPVRACLGDAELWMAPPPSVGGMWIGFAAAVLDRLPVPPPHSEAEILLLRAVMTTAHEVRATIVGSDTPTYAHAHQILDGAVIEAGVARARALVELGACPLPAGPIDWLGGTTHLSVIDERGNACAITVSNGECNGLVLPGLGVFVNNFLGEEDLNPRGFFKFKPGVRLGSAMCPMVMRRRDGTVTALGSGGSNRIRTALLQVVRRQVMGADLATAVRADRIHVEPGRVYAEAFGANGPAVQSLKEPLGIGVFEGPNMFFGGVHAVARSRTGSCSGVGDPRRSGVALTQT